MCNYSAFIKGPPTATVMCKYFTFKEASTATVMCKYFTFKGEQQP